MISHCTCYCWKAPGHLRDGVGVSAILFVCSFALIQIRAFSGVTTKRQSPDSLLSHAKIICSFPLLFAFLVGGLGFEFCVFVAGWGHALRSEWPFIIVIIIIRMELAERSHEQTYLG